MDHIYYFILHSSYVRFSRRTTWDGVSGACALLRGAPRRKEEEGQGLGQGWCSASRGFSWRPPSAWALGAPGAWTPPGLLSPWARRTFCSLSPLYLVSFSSWEPWRREADAQAQRPQPGQTEVAVKEGAGGPGSSQCPHHVPCCCLLESCCMTGTLAVCYVFMRLTRYLLR